MFKKIPINSVIIALSCIGAGLVILSTWHYSIGLWEDSIGYIATAKNLLLGKGFISYNAQPITLWPPFYPILLYLLSTILGPNLLVIALLLNAVLFGLIIYEFGTLLTKYINSEIAILLGLLYTLFSIPIFSRTLWAGSEIIFIFLYIWHTHFLVSYLEKKSLTSFIMIVILTAFAILTRYIGITLIFTTGIAIIIYNRENIKKNIGIILIYSILSIIPISIWSIRNYMISKSLFGVEGTSEASFPLNIYLTIKNIIAWYVPVFLVNQKIFLFIITLTIIALGVFLLKRIKREDLWLKTEKKIFLIQSSFILIYLFLLILIATFKAIDNINSRLLSPVFIPIIFLLLILIHSLKKTLPLLGIVSL